MVTYQEWKAKKAENSQKNTEPKVVNKRAASIKQGYEDWKKRKAEQGDLLTSQQRNERNSFQESWGENSKNIDRYLQESSNYLQNARKNFYSDGGRETAQNLRSQGMEYLNYLNQNGKYMDEQTRRNISDALRSIDLGYTSTIRLYSNFDTEDDYLKWEAYSTTENRQERYEQNQKRLSELEAEKIKVQNDMNTFQPGTNPYTYGGYSVSGAGYGAAAQNFASGNSGPQAEKLNALNAEINSIKREMTMYERGGTDADTGFYYGSKVVDDYSAYLNDPNYGQFSAEDFQNPTKDDLRYYDAMMDQSTWYQDGSGNTRNRLGDIVTESVYADDPRYQIADPLGAYLQATPEDLANMHGDGSTQLGVLNQLLMDGYYGSWDQLDESEREIYYTLLGTQGKEAAMKYLSDMETELNRRNMAQESELYKLAFERANGWQRLGMSAVSIPANLLGGATAFVDDLSHTVRGEEINPYSAAHQMQNYGQQVRANQAAAFDESSSWEIPFIDFSAGDLYQAAMSTADRFGGAKIGPTTYGALMGMGAASSEARRLYEMGASKDQIFWGSAAAGAAEMVFEKIGLDKLLGIKNVDTLGKAVLAALISGGVVEAGEEGGTELANLITNHLIMTSESDWTKLVEENNGDKWAAARAAAGQIGEAAAGGFVSGLIGGTFSATANYSGNYFNDMKQGAAIREGEGLKPLLDLAMAMAEKENGKAQAALQKQSERLGKKFVYDFTRDRAAGRLYRTVQNTVSEANKADVANALQEKGYTQKQAQNIADAFYTQAVGMEVSKDQQKVISKYGSNENVQKVIGDLLFNSESSIAKRNQNLQNFRFDVAKNQLINKLEKATGEKLNPEANNAAEEIDDSTPSLTVSEDGSTKVISTGKSVKIEGFASTKEGNVTLRTDSGEAVDISDISYANDSDALIYEAIASLGAPVSNANALLKAYQGKSDTDAEIFARGIQEAFEYGQLGIPMAEMADSAFASKLSKFQMEYAYKRGTEKADVQNLRRRYSVKSAVKEANAVATKAQREHRVVLEEDISVEEMTTSQKVTYDYLNKIVKGIKGEIHVYSAKTGEMGYYDKFNDRIYLNINATNKSEKSLMVFVLGHELVHRAKVGSPEKYEAFKDFLLDQYGKRGASVEDMIDQQIDAAKEQNIKMTREEALEEVVCDACQRMLLDTDAGKKLAAFGAQSEQNRTFLDDIRRIVHEFMEKMRAIFSGVNADSSLAAEEFNKFDAQVKRILADMYVDMTMEAGKNLDTIMNAYGKNTLVELTQDGEVALAQNADGSQKVFNLVTWENGGRETLVATLKREGYTQDDIDAALTIMDANYNLVKKIANEVDGNGKLAFPEQGRINEATLTTDIKDGHSVLSALVSNGDYPVNIDLLMVCKKRKAYQRVINRLCETGMIKQATVDALAIAEINKILGKYGFETACLGCFVESRRLRIQEWAETIVKEWNSEVKKRNPNAKPFGFGKGDGKLGPDEIMKLIGELESGGEKNDKGNLNLGVGSAVKRMGVLLDKVPTLRRTLTVDDLITPEGLSRLRRFDSNLFSMVKSRYGSNSPKFVQEFNPYNHELARYGKVPTQYNNIREYLYAIGGARMQSFSDFIVENWFDYTQIVADLAARKLPMHTYTKEIAMVKLFGMTGIKINMSLIPDVDKTLGKEYAGLTRNADGKLELIWADKDRNKATGGKSYMQSINAREAFALQNDPRYSSNIGTIAIGVSDMQIRMMLNDSRIRMVIPYHSSGMNPIYADMMGTSFYKDYTNVQNTTIKQIYNSKGQPVSLKLSKPQIAQLTGGFLFNDVLQNLGDARAAAEAYKEWCADSSKHTITIKGETYTAELTPKFNDFAKEPNYYKLLEDFNTYDCITEQAAPQGDVQQIYPEGFEKILRAELKDQETHRKTQAENKAFDKAMADIESYLKSHTKADTVYYAQQAGIKLSKKDSKLDAADKERLKQLQEQGASFMLPKVDKNNPKKLPIGEDTSTRTLLANAFDSVITNPVEKQKLQEYRQNIEKMNEQEAKLRELKAQIKELSFAKGPRDKAKIAALQEEARKTENRINTYDGILLRNEAAEPLQRVLKRAKAKAVERQKAKMKSAEDDYRRSVEVKQSEMLRNYRAIREELTQQKRDTSTMEKEFIRLAKAYEKKVEQAEKADAKSNVTIKDLRDALIKEANSHKEDQKIWYKEFSRLLKEYENSGDKISRLEDKIVQQRNRAKEKVESRKRTELRHKIQNVVAELNRLLLSNDKKAHVPDSLKKAVADALDLVNMDTVDAEARAAKYASLIEKETDPDKIAAYTVTMENILRQGEKVGQRLNELRSAYEDIQKSTDPDIANAYDPVIAGNLKELAESIGNTSIKNMTLEQLSDVYDMYRMVLTRVRDANKALMENMRASIGAMADYVVSEVKRVGGEKKYRVSALDPVSQFLWNNLKPVYAMETIGSSTLTKVFENVRHGEDVWAVDVTDARKFFLANSKKYGFNKWDFKKKYSFESASGISFELTLDQILSLYAYSKREQAHDHLRLGGFVFDSNIETTKEKDGKNSILKYKVNTADAHQITPDILADITGNLSAEQKQFVDAMQGYLSDVMGAKGNEVTMKMYGVKLFKEQNYFPLKSAKQFMFEQNEVSGEVRIKNSGFTNKVVAKANNPVILSNFMDVWSDHVDAMSMYHAFTLPLEDFNRVFNYNTPKAEGQESVSVKGTIQNAYGPAAVSYVKQLITDLNGGARSDSTTGWINKMMGMYKKGAVFASLSVVVQQPSAIARAAALIDTKYFIGRKVDPQRHKMLWNEVKKYAPIAIIKEMGYFDTNIGKSTRDFILSQEHDGWIDLVKRVDVEGLVKNTKDFVIDSDYRDEVLSWAPAYADELAWCGIWEAVKRETKAKHPNMDGRTEEFLKLCGARFTEVITKTQVYDSVLSRSANMRSKDTGMKMATAFMAEPTTSINMVADALLKGKRGNRKYARAAIGAVIASQILNSILVSFVYAGRDDDEDETYWEKYVEHLTANMVDSLNPIGYIPFLRDILSIVQGYDVERSDMAVISDLWKAWQNLKKDTVSPYMKFEGFVGSVAQIFGLPAKNILRDSRGVYNTIVSFVDGRYSTKAGFGYAFRSGLPKWMGGGAVSNQNQLYDAYLNDDSKQIARVEERYEEESDAHNALRKALRENDPRIREAAEYLNSDDYSSYLDIVEEIMDEGHFDRDDVIKAIRSEASALAPEEGSGVSKAQSLMTAEQFAIAVANGDNDVAKIAMDDIIATAQENGKTESEAVDSFHSSAKSALKDQYLVDTLSGSDAEKALVAYCGMDAEEAAAAVRKWEFESESGFAYGSMRQEFLDKHITAAQARDALITYGGETGDDADDIIEGWQFESQYGFAWENRAREYKDQNITQNELRTALMKKGGMTSEEADIQIQVYDWEMEGYDGASFARVRDYNAYCSAQRVPVDVYLYIRKFASNTQNDIVNGKAVDYSAVKKIMAEINAQRGLTPAQKTAIAKSIGWKDSTIRKYKLW